MRQKIVYIPKINNEYLKEVQFGFLTDIFDFCCYSHMTEFAAYNIETSQIIKTYDITSTKDLIELSNLVGINLAQ